MTTVPSADEQEAAWFEYIELKRKTEQAFDRFKELYLAEDEAAGRTVGRPLADNVRTFPVHRSRMGGHVPRGAA